MSRNVRALLAQGLLFLECFEQQKKENAELREEMRRHNEVAATWPSCMQTLSDHFDKHVRKCEKYSDAGLEGASGSESSDSSEEERSNRRELKRKSHRDREKTNTNTNKNRRGPRS